MGRTMVVPRSPPPPETAADADGFHRFRNGPFGRDVVQGRRSMREEVFDHGRATAPRIPGPHMLPSTIPVGSASAIFGFRGSIAHPARSLCTLRDRRRRRPRNTRYRAPATAYPCRSSTGKTGQLAWRTGNPNVSSRQVRRDGPAPRVYASSSPSSVSPMRSTETTRSSSAVWNTITPCVARPAMRMPATGTRMS